MLLGKRSSGRRCWGSPPNGFQKEGHSRSTPAIHQKVVAEEKSSVFGKYSPLDQAKIGSLESDQKLVVDTIKASAKKNALLTVAIFPAIMLVCYLILILYFRSKGGYKAEELTVQVE